MKSNVSIMVTGLNLLFNHFNICICIISFFNMILLRGRHSLESIVIGSLLVPKLVRRRLLTGHMSLLTTHILVRPCHGHPPTHLLLTIHIDSFPTCITTTFFSPIPLLCSNFYSIYGNYAYQFLLFTSIHHPTFYIVHSTSPLFA
jgi:hypothetical protein